MTGVLETYVPHVDLYMIDIIRFDRRQKNQIHVYFHKRFIYASFCVRRMSGILNATLPFFFIAASFL